MLLASFYVVCVLFLFVDKMKIYKFLVCEWSSLCPVLLLTKVWSHNVQGTNIFKVKMIGGEMFRGS